MFKTYTKVAGIWEAEGTRLVQRFSRREVGLEAIGRSEWWAGRIINVDRSDNKVDVLLAAGNGNWGANIAVVAVLKLNINGHLSKENTVSSVGFTECNWSNGR